MQNVIGQNRKKILMSGEIVRIRDFFITVHRFFHRTIIHGYFTIKFFISYCHHLQINIENANLVCEKYGMQLAQIHWLREHDDVKNALNYNGKFLSNICFKNFYQTLPN
jgi:hypothetical protein